MENISQNSMLVGLGAVAGVMVLGQVARKLWSKNGEPPMPPGPPGKPLIGNLLDMPSEFEWLAFTKWRESYGDINSINIFGQTIVVLQSREVCRKLLELKSGSASSRPYLTMSSELVGWGLGLALLEYGPRLRETRKQIHNKLMGQKNVSRYQPIKTREATQLLLKAIARPEDLEAHVRHFTAVVIVEILYGYQIKAEKDPLVKIAQLGIDAFSHSSTPGAFLVDMIPILKYVPAWFPGARFKRLAAEWRQDVKNAINTPFGMVKKDITQGTAQPSFCRDIMEESQGDEWKEDVLKWGAGSMYAGGADTTVSALRTFFVLMATHPEIQARLQRDIDAVTGGSRLPTFADRAQLPIIDATIKECMRVFGITPLAVPHLMTQTEILDGYTIPKGAIVFANVWGMDHDAAVYQEPSTFNPDRFMNLGVHHGLDDPLTNMETFGFGRRVCPGKDLADSSLWITVALTLATVNISDLKDMEDKPLTMETIKYTPGVITHPQPYKVSITPRSDLSHNLLKAAALSFEHS